MEDKAYTALQNKLMSANANTPIDQIFADMTALHLECNRRSVLAFHKEIAARKVQSKKMIACRNHVQDVLGYRISLGYNNVYSRSQWQ